MKELEKHTSPDGKLTFVVSDDQGDLHLGFENFPSHTHGDILAALSGLKESDDVRQYIDDLLMDKAPIVIRKIHSKIVDIWITDDVSDELEGLKKYGETGETMEFRSWSGKNLREICKEEARV